MAGNIATVLTLKSYSKWSLYSGTEWYKENATFGRFSLILAFYSPSTILSATALCRTFTSNTPEEYMTYLPGSTLGVYDAAARTAVVFL